MKAKDPICGMQVDPRTAVSCSRNGQDHFFCGEPCLQKFLRSSPGHSCAAPSPAPWFSDKLFITATVLTAIIAASYYFEILTPFRNALWMYFSHMGGMLFLGFILAGVLDRLIPKEYISVILSQPQKRTIFYSVFLGFLMSACSHGILALSMQMYKKGASTPVVVSFLLASPWANLPITLILFSLFGLKALYIIFGALFIALTTGLIFQVLEAWGWVEKNPHTYQVPEGYSVAGHLRSRIRSYRFSLSGFAGDIAGSIENSWSLARMVLWWILLGMALSSFFSAYIPSGLFEKHMGPSLGGLLVTLLAATVIEVCSEGTAPLAFEIFKKTGAFGNAFVFLMAGVVTDYTEIGLLWSNIGRRTALWLPVIAVPQAVILGMLANYLFKT